MFFCRKNEELEELLNTLQVNLENNYKDLAIQARKDAEACFARLDAQGALNKKTRARYRARLDEYAGRMAHYDHTNISKFLKEHL